MSPEPTGRARRSPADYPRPLIGEETAIARALAVLSQQLLKAAWGKIYADVIRWPHRHGRRAAG